MNAFGRPKRAAQILKVFPGYATILRLAVFTNHRESSRYGGYNGDFLRGPGAAALPVVVRTKVDEPVRAKVE
jgi:hypothetical protein